jgi:hypothetical protein
MLAPIVEPAMRAMTFFSSVSPTTFLPNVAVGPSAHRMKNTAWPGKAR